MTKAVDHLRRRRLVVSIVFACTLALVGPVSAQVQEATIFGQVTDESGAVLPGVTITVSSPALLQQRSEVTDARGEYRVTPLPLGLYTTEYTLPGFQTLRRENIRLTAGFVARVDVALHVGGVAESVTVSGASPVVDVRTTSAGTQLTREILETIPTNRNSLNSLLTMAAGTRPPLESGFVGGSDPIIVVFGRRNEGWIQVEGVSTTSIQANPASWNRLDYELFEEATIQTIGAAAESTTSGAQISVIVKSGGNAFHGSSRASYTAPGWMQGNNIDDELIRQGITEPAKFTERWDTRAEMGGRIVRDRVWFYGSVRKRVDAAPLAGGFNLDGSPSMATTDQRFWAGKVTAQLTSSQKLIGAYLWQGNHREQGHDSLGSPEEFWIHQFNNYVAKGEWQIARGNKFLSVVGGRFFAPGDNLFENTDIAQFEDEVTGRHGGIEDRGAQYTDNGRDSAKATLNWYKPDMWRGNHDFKVGGEWTRGYRQQNNLDRRAGNYVLRYRSGVPFQVRVKNNPVNPDGYIDYVGLYGQDSWAINRRVTLNLGLRYANDRAFLPAQCREAGTAPFASVFPAQCWPERDAQTWDSLAPRLHVAYDVTGDGKTVIKGGWARFRVMNNLGDLDARNPNAPISTTFLWRDLNSNRRFDAGESNLALNGPDFVSTAQSGNANLSGLIDNPDLKEPGSDEFSLSFERELMANLGLRVTTIYSKDFNSLRILNTLRPYEVYNIPINNPDPGIDNILGNADDPGTILTYWDYPASLAGAAFQRPMFINHDGSNASYKSIEVAAVRRLSNRWQFNLAYTATKKQNVGLAYASQTGGAFDPNYEINNVDNTWEWLTRGVGTYLLPGDIQVAGNLTYQSGDVWGRTVAVRGGRTVPSLVMRVEPLGARRTENAILMSMHASKVLRLRQGHQLKIGTNIINLFNGNYVTVTGAGLPSINTRSGPQFGFISGGAFGIGNTVARPRIGEIEISYSF